MSKLEYFTGDFQDPLDDYEPREYESPLEEALAEETVAAIQATPYAEISSEEPVSAALKVLSGLKVASLLVVENGRLVGVFTERDVLERVATDYEDVQNLPVRLLMTENPVVVYDTDPAGRALSAIATAGYRNVPVLNLDDEVVGVISLRRVLSFLNDRSCCA